MEHIQCPLCNSESFTELFSGSDLLYKIGGNFLIVECNECGFRFVNPRPSKEEIKKYYPSDYHCYFINTHVLDAFISFEKKFSLLFKLINSFEQEYPILKKKAQVLEIGCGGGSFLYSYNKKHPTHSIKGVDFDKQSVEMLQKIGLNAEYSDLSVFHESDATYDMVVGWMILEHVHDVHNLLQELHRILKKEGRFIFSVPNAGSWQFKFFHKYWYSLHVPGHLSFFTESTIELFLEKSGFVIEKIYHQRTGVDLINSMRLYFQENINNKGLNRFVSRILSWNKGYFLLMFPIACVFSLFRQSSRITIHAKKKAS